MSIRSTLDPYGGCTSMIDKLIGDAYPNVKAVSDALEKIDYIIANMQSIVRTATLVAALDPATLHNYANDAAAATGGVVVGGLYRNGSVLMIRVA
jgi:hypothetical protein